ncbi:Transposable element P transposase, partial [Paramuricea clavata]
VQQVQNSGGTTYFNTIASPFLTKQERDTDSFINAFTHNRTNFVGAERSFKTNHIHGLYIEEHVDFKTACFVFLNRREHKYNINRRYKNKEITLLLSLKKVSTRLQSFLAVILRRFVAKLYLWSRIKQQCRGNFNVASVKCKTPLSCLSKEQLIATVKDTRVNLKEAKLKCAQLERRVQRMENEIKHHGIRIETGLGKELTSIITNTSLEATPHMKLVWEQQKKALNQQSNFGNRWYPHFIRFCLPIYSKSPIVYQELRDSGTMQLPSSRTFRSYRNNFKPGAGYLPENIKPLISRTKGFLDKDKWIVVMFDEMKIKCNLVFDKHSGRLVGFVDIGDPDVNYSTFDKIEPATHVLAFYVRGITTKLQFMLGYFFTRDVVSYQLMPLFWRGVAILQLKANLNVIAAVSDGASPNRKFYQLHIYIGEKLNNQKVLYKTKGKWIWFFADAPHLLKTARNCLLKSGSGLKSRCMWNNDQFLLWNYISDLYYSDLELGLHQLPKLTIEHIMLTSYSKMRVNLAAQGKSQMDRKQQSILEITDIFLLQFVLMLSKQATLRANVIGQSLFQNRK